MRKRLRKPSIGIFKVGEPHIDQVAQRRHGTRTLVTTRVVDDWDDQPAHPCSGNRSRQQVRIVRRRHQIDVVRTLVLQFQHNLDQALRRNLKPKIAGRDLVILAVDTFKRAAAKEDRARTGFARDRRLLPHMKRRSRRPDLPCLSAKTCLSILSVRPTHPRT